MKLQVNFNLVMWENRGEIMKLFHLSDLHIGKQLHSYSLRKNQEDILNKIVEQAILQRPNAILIAGDIFDKSIPSAEAYTVFDDFLNKLANIVPTIPVLIIAGNHDSAERLRYASSFLEKHQIYISVMPPQEEGEYLRKITLQDEYGDVNFYLLPFVKPGYVRHLFEEGYVTSYHSAIQALLEREEIDYSQRNCLLSHQFYVNGGQAPETSDSEQSSITVGGLDSVDASLVEQFDYVALGHIHKPQHVLKPTIRYCGTPLKYSVSEEKHKKSITVVTLSEKGSEIGIESIPLYALQDVRRERGLLQEILDRATQDNCHDYISVTITDEVDPYKPKDQLEEKYDNILELMVDNTRTQARINEVNGEATVLDPILAFSEFYQEMQQCPMSEKEEEIIASIINISREED